MGSERKRRLEGRGVERWRGMESVWKLRFVRCSEGLRRRSCEGDEKGGLALEEENRRVDDEVREYVMSA